jgi:hypothetical protein
LAITKYHEKPFSDCHIRSGSGTLVPWLDCMDLSTTGAHTRGKNARAKEQKILSRCGEGMVKDYLL